MPYSSPFFLAALFFCNDTATTEIYTLSLHDALPISPTLAPTALSISLEIRGRRVVGPSQLPDRKSTRLNSSHVESSYAVFCLKKKNEHTSEGRQYRTQAPLLELNGQHPRPTRRQQQP